jgi:hypothetical protein
MFERYEKNSYIAFMKKILYLLTIIVLFQCGSSSFRLFRPKPMPVVDKIFQPYSAKLDSIYEANEIEVDYTKVSRITHIDSVPSHPELAGRVFEGLYDPVNKIVYINPRQIDAFFAGHYNNFLLLILAHEIAHSQGKPHSSDENSIMYVNSSNSLNLLDECTVEELVTAIYLEDYPVYVPKPTCPYCGRTH